MFTKIKDDLKNEALEKGRSMSLKDLESKIDAHENTMRTALEEAGDDLNLSVIKVFGEGKSGSEIIDSMVKVHSEFAGYQDAFKEKEEMAKARAEILQNNVGDDARKKAEEAAARARDTDTTRGQIRQLSDRLRSMVTPEQLKAASQQPVVLNLDMPGNEILNTLFQTSAGWSPESTREAGVLLSPQRPIEVLDTIPSRPTAQAAVKYMEETTFTNNAGGVPEGTSYAGDSTITPARPSRQAALALTEQTKTIQKFGVYLPVTEEQLEDVPEADAYLNQRLPFMLRQEVEDQVVAGSGTAPDIQGVIGTTNNNTRDFTSTGSGATTVLTAGSMLGDLLKGIGEVRRTGRTRPSSIWLLQEAWEDIVIAQLAANGYFFQGDPQTGYSPRAWGLPVVETTHETYAVPAANATRTIGVIGDFLMFAAVRVRRDMELRIGLTNDDFLKDQMTMKASVRFVLVVYRPQAFTEMRWPRT